MEKGALPICILLFSTPRLFSASPGSSPTLFHPGLLLVASMSPCLDYTQLHSYFTVALVHAERGGERWQLFLLFSHSFIPQASTAPLYCLDLWMHLSLLQAITVLHVTLIRKKNCESLIVSSLLVGNVVCLAMWHV